MPHRATTSTSCSTRAAGIEEVSRSSAIVAPTDKNLAQPNLPSPLAPSHTDQRDGGPRGDSAGDPGSEEPRVSDRRARSTALAWRPQIRDELLRQPVDLFSRGRTLLHP